MKTYGKWEEVKPLGEGGQGAVFLVKNTQDTGETTKLLAEIRRAVLSLAQSTQPPDSARKSAEELIKAINCFSPNIPTVHLGALKMLHKPKESAGFEKALERMKQEVNALRSMDHPNILKGLDANVDERWFVGEYHPGGTLWQKKDLFKGNILGALTALRPLVEAVAQLHRSDRVHRDIKPHNVFVASDGRLVLGDFGIVFFEDHRTRVTEKYENVAVGILWRDGQWASASTR